jgi:hypothetical protein
MKASSPVQHSQIAVRAFAGFGVNSKGRGGAWACEGGRGGAGARYLSRPPSDCSIHGVWQRREAHKSGLLLKYLSGEDYHIH